MVSHHHYPPPSLSSRSEHPAASSQLPLPPVGRASSVTSGRSATRRHRHARTHHGGSAPHQPHNEFPYFAYTGDVELVISNESGTKENRYLLHRLILSQCSAFFEAGTRVEWSSARAIENGPSTSGALARISENGSVTATNSSRASSQERRPSLEPSRKRWRYVLDWHTADRDHAPMLVQRDEDNTSIFGGSSGQPPPVRNKPPASNDNFFRSMTQFSALNINERSQPSSPAEPGDETLKDYDNLFRTMYQYTPVLDSVNIATAYTECKALLHLADMYDALEIVGSRVDHHLLRFGARLFKQIAKYPPSYLKLGYLARSSTIFTEAFIHVAGQWPLAAPQLRGQMDAAIMELLEDKVDELREMEERVEFKLWRLTLTTSRGERVTPANDFLSWLAMSLFRQWLAENTTPAPTPILKPATSSSTRGTSRTSSRGSNHIASQRTSSQAVVLASQTQPASQPSNTGRVYRLIGSTSSTAYLSHDELKRFLKLQPDLYTRENLRRFERRMDEVKNLARDIVKPLMRNFLELDLSAWGSTGGLGYLTCTRLTENELPWS